MKFGIFGTFINKTNTLTNKNTWQTRTMLHVVIFFFEIIKRTERIVSIFIEINKLFEAKFLVNISLAEILGIQHK